MGFVIRWCSVLLFLVACTKEPVYMERKANNSSASFSKWLKSNCQYRVVESSTGAIVFDASQVMLDGSNVDQRGVYYFLNDQGFPVLKEINQTGYTRDIQLGSLSDNCPDYKTLCTKVTLNIVAGAKMLTLVEFPVAIMQHKTVPDVSWKVNAPKTIQINLNGIN